MPKKKKGSPVFPDRPCACGGTMSASKFFSNWQEPCYVVFHCSSCDQSMLRQISYKDQLTATDLTLQDADTLKHLGFAPSSKGNWHRSGLILDKIHSTWYLSADFSSDSYCCLSRCSQEDFPQAFERWLTP